MQEPVFIESDTLLFYGNTQDYVVVDGGTYESWHDLVGCNMPREGVDFATVRFPVWVVLGVELNEEETENEG